MKVDWWRVAGLGTMLVSAYISVKLYAFLIELAVDSMMKGIT